MPKEKTPGKQSEIRDLIANNDIAEAIKMLRESLGDNTAIALENQWTQLRQDETTGILSYKKNDAPAKPNHPGLAPTGRAGALMATTFTPSPWDWNKVKTSLRDLWQQLSFWRRTGGCQPKIIR
ncbi:MAG: hypothetical protein EPO28_11650 [Saprospiraceae bacterium]|nr:MAG: hypothetical protein EPO28_11650 [Saprospiraceae bacterium]